MEGLKYLAKTLLPKDVYIEMEDYRKKTAQSKSEFIRQAIISKLKASDVY